MNKNQQREMTGFSVLESLLVVTALAVLLMGVTYYVQKSSTQQLINKSLQVFNEVNSASKQFVTINGEATGLSVQALVDLEYLPANYGNGVGKNPVGGNVVVAALSAAGVADYKVEFTEMPSFKFCDKIKEKIVSEQTATCIAAGATYTLQVRGTI